MKTQKKSFKVFYYFRTGYATYFAMIVGVVNIMTTTYFLAAKKIPLILQLFPTFQSYVLALVLTGIPIVVLMGWLHLKRIGTYSAEANITTEAHPYSYKLAPGILREVFGPAYLWILRLNMKRAMGEKLTEDEMESIKKIEDQLVKLINGGYVGNPPKGLF